MGHNLWPINRLKLKFQNGFSRINHEIHMKDESRKISRIHHDYRFQDFRPKNNYSDSKMNFYISWNSA